MIGLTPATPSTAKTRALSLQQDSTADNDRQNDLADQKDISHVLAFIFITEDPLYTAG